MSTLPKPDTDEELDPGQRHWDNKFNSTIDQRRRELNERENQPSPVSMDELDDDSSRAVSSFEEAGAGDDAGWTYNNSDSANGSKGNFSGTFTNVAKKGGPVGVIIGFLIIAAAVLSFFGGPGLLIVNFAEILTEKFNYQLGSMEARHTKILESKLKNTTTGSCGVVTWRCKYTTFSDKEIAKFKAAGLKVELDGKSILGRNKIKSFSIDGKTVEAKDFSKAIKEGGKFSDAIRHSYSIKLAGTSDSVFNKVMAKIGSSKKAPFEEGEDDKARAKTIEEDTKNGKGSTKPGSQDCGDTCTEEQKKQNAAASEGADQSNKLTDSSANSTVNQADEIIAENADKLAKGATSTSTDVVTRAGMEAAQKSIVGAATSIIKITGPIDNACMVYGWVKTISYTAKTIRMIQMARYAMIFLTTASMIKSGDAKPADVAYIGTILTKVVQQKDGKMSKSATDSFGYRYAAHGDSGINDAASTAVAGASFGGTIQGIVNTILTPLGGKKSADNTCHILANPIVQGASIVVGVVSFFFGAGEVKLTAQMAIAPLIAIVGAFLPAMIGDMIAGRLVDENTFGERSGNLITSGAGGMLSKVSSYGGNSILHKDQARAYMEYQDKVLADYADYDRRTHSAFDASNPNTFLGSLYTQFAPYLYSSQTPIALAGNITSIIGSTANNLLSPALHAAGTESYAECADPDFKDLDVATDPFCNPVTGIPPQYLGGDSVEVGNRLETKGYIDTATGEPKSGSEYENFVKTCIQREDPYGSSQDGETDNTDSCFIDSQEKADMYVHFTDQRINTIQETDISSTSALNSLNLGDIASVAQPEMVYAPTAHSSTPLVSTAKASSDLNTSVLDGVHGDISLMSSIDIGIPEWLTYGNFMSVARTRNTFSNGIVVASISNNLVTGISTV